MRHKLKITLFVELDTEHPNYMGVEDIDYAPRQLEEWLTESAPEELEYGLRLEHLHVEAVE